MRAFKVTVRELKAWRRGPLKEAGPEHQQTLLTSVRWGAVCTRNRANDKLNLVIMRPGTEGAPPMLAFGR